MNRSAPARTPPLAERSVPRLRWTHPSGRSTQRTSSPSSLGAALPAVAADGAVQRRQRRALPAVLRVRVPRERPYLGEGCHRLAPFMSTTRTFTGHLGFPDYRAIGERRSARLPVAFATTPALGPPPRQRCAVPDPRRRLVVMTTARHGATTAQSRSTPTCIAVSRHWTHRPSRARSGSMSGASCSAHAPAPKRC